MWKWCNSNGICVSLTGHNCSQSCERPIQAIPSTTSPFAPALRAVYVQGHSAFFAALLHRLERDVAPPVHHSCLATFAGELVWHDCSTFTAMSGNRRQQRQQQQQVILSQPLLKPGHGFRFAHAQALIGGLCRSSVCATAPSATVGLTPCCTFVHQQEGAPGDKAEAAQWNTLAEWHLGSDVGRRFAAINGGMCAQRVLTASIADHLLCTLGPSPEVETPCERLVMLIVLGTLQM